jgi:hypothetical protein
MEILSRFELFPLSAQCYVYSKVDETAVAQTADFAGQYHTVIVVMVGNGQARHVFAMLTAGCPRTSAFARGFLLFEII